jgi:hypothetical protein
MKKTRRKNKKSRTTEKQKCETVKLWTQAVDYKGSTVSQFHKTGGGGGSLGMGGWGAGRRGKETVHSSQFAVHSLQFPVGLEWVVNGRENGGLEAVNRGSRIAERGP